VLDLGCGQGRDALFIARKGHSVFGVDSLKPVYILVARGC
jgi:2-polyprenyl-3-methyl-5-hydroxy-6-metoxy-1,4-benzoquinol methylase